jgi:hypothetical protein
MNFLHCISVLDAIQVLIQCTKNSGLSLFYHYKIQFCIVLLALVDAKHSFQYVQVGVKEESQMMVCSEIVI